MKKLLLSLIVLIGHLNVHAQSDVDFLPQIKILALDSTERVAQRFCKEVMAHVDGYKFAFVDREDVYMSKYVYDNKEFDALKFEFQFGIKEVMLPDSSVAKQRVVKLQYVVGDLKAITQVYNYLFDTEHTKDKILAISRYDKAFAYKGKEYNSLIITDDSRAGYWLLRLNK